MLDSNCLYVQDENGEEKKMIILFTFDGPDGDKQYVVFQDPEGDDELYAAIYNNEGELFAIESEEELDMVQEVINTFLEDEEEVDD